MIRIKSGCYMHYIFAILLLAFNNMAEGVHKKSVAVKQPSSLTAPLNNQVFDFAYSGDVVNIPQLLRQYDTNLTILPALGQKKDLNVNINLQSVRLEDINDALISQTAGQVRFIYVQNNDSLRLSFTPAGDVAKDALDESLKWQNGSLPKPVLKADGVIRFPYGEYQPVITCQPLNLCDIELQAGENISGIVIGDSVHWNEGDQGIPVVYSGSGNSLAAHVVLKPDQGGLDTSLLLTTSKRTYSIKLKSANNGYIARAGFYYPAEMVQRFNEQARALQREHEIASAPDLQLSLFDLSKAQYHYKIEGSNYIWKPVQVFDDGISVYIQMPPEVSSRSLPAICVLPDADTDTKSCEVVNFRYLNHFYIVDRLFDAAKLISGYGDSMQTVTIRKNPRPGFFARLFGGV